MNKMNYEEIGKIIKRFENVECQSADICDALDVLGMHDQCLDLKIRPFKDDSVIVGPAFTYFGTKEPRFDADLPMPEVDNHRQFDLMYPGCVIVMAANDECVGHFGELMSWGAHNEGAVGCVIDGACRDRKNVNKIPNFGMFARFSSPIESKGRWRPKEVEHPILMSGATKRYVRVEPGDWVFGDLDGVVIIPKKAIYDTIQRVEKIYALECNMRADLAKGERFIEVNKKHPREDPEYLITRHI